MIRNKETEQFFTGDLAKRRSAYADRVRIKL